MGSGKTGKFLCSEWMGTDNKPDMITLGKSITGGVYPASYILGFADLGIVIKEGVDNVTPRRIARLAYQKGVLIYPPAPRIRLSVALTITDEELDRGLRILTEVMDEVRFYEEIPGSTHAVDDVAAGF